MTNLDHTTRSLYQTAMRILNQQPQWVNPDMSADFTDHTITIAQGHTQYKIQFDETHGLLIAHTTHNNTTQHKPIATEQDSKTLFEDIYQQLA